MKHLNFWKYHGLGNDFVMFNGLDNAESILGWLAPDVITALCDRHNGVGADGVVVAGRTESGYRMTYFNADGYEAEMCGNGLRCTVALLTNLGEDLSHETDIATGGGPVKAVVLPDGNIRNTMPAPIFQGITGIPKPGDLNLQHAVDINGVRFNGVIINIGNPHYVINKKVSLKELTSWGPRLENHKLFPDRTNIEFIEALDRQSIQIQIWERGVGSTMACGSGATASVAAAAALGLVDHDQDITVQMDGGKLSVNISSDFQEIWLQGPAQLVFRGELTTEGGWDGLV